MKHRIRFLTFLIMGMSISLYSQDWMGIVDSMQGQKFSKITEAIEKSWEGLDKGKGSGYKQYQRWKHENEQTLKDGYTTNRAAERWAEYYSNDNANSLKASPSGFQGNWNSLAPSSYQKMVSSGVGHQYGNGRINCIEVDPSNPDIIYAGTPCGGLWKTEDNGETWIPLTDGMPQLGVSGIAIDPSSDVNSRTLYMLTGDGDSWDTHTQGVFKSVDGGNQWAHTGMHYGIFSYMVGFKLLMHPVNYNTLFAVTSKGIFRTLNGGISWDSTLTSQSFRDIEFNPANPDIIYASTGAGTIYKSIDGGDSWSQIGASTLPSISQRVAIAVTPDDPNYIYAIYGGSTSTPFAGIYRSTDGGNTFTLQANSPTDLGKSQSGYNLTIEVSPTDKDEVYVGTVFIYKSTDGGVSWSSIVSYTENGEYRSIHVDFHEMKFVGNTLYVGNDGGIYYSTNYGESWVNITSDMEITQFYRIGLINRENNPVMGGAQDNGTNRIEDDILYHFNGGDGMECFGDPDNSNIIYTSSQKGSIYKSTDYGLSDQSIRPSNSGTGAWITPFEMDPQNNEILYAGYMDLFKSFNAGENWTRISDQQIEPNELISDIAIAPSDGNCIYMKKRNLYRTTDGGNTWTQCNTYLGQFSARILVHPYNKDIVWVACSQTVMKTTDGGVNWVDLKLNLPDLWSKALVYQEGSNDRIYYANNIGVYYIDNSLTEWVEFSNGLIGVEIKDLQINYNTQKLVAGTYGRGIWESDLYIDCNDGTTITVPAPSTPSLKSATVAVGVPVIIEAESFTETGGTYSDSYAGGPGYGVNNSGTGINYVNTNDWVEYDIPASIDPGIYKIEYDISTPSDNAQIKFELDGTVISTDNVPNNGQWDVYGLIEAGQNLTYSGGGSTIKITASGTNDWQWNLDNFVLTKISDIQVDVTGVTVAPATSSIEEGQAVQLTETIEPSNATNKNVSWSSNNTAVATVDANGLVTAVSEGNATITVTTEQGSYTATSSITVTPIHIPVTGVNVSPVSHTLEEGNTVQLNETVLPTDATNKNVSWSSNNTAVATVDSDGLVSAIGEGNATITVTTEEGGFTVTSAITVTESAYSITYEAEIRQAPSGSFPVSSSSSTETNGSIISGSNGDLCNFMVNSIQSGLYKVEFNMGSAVDGATIGVRSGTAGDTYYTAVPNHGVWDEFEWVTMSEYINIDGPVDYSLFIMAEGPDGKVLELDKLKLTRMGDLNIPVISLEPVGDTLISVRPGSSHFVECILTPNNATNTNISWSTNNTNLVTLYSPYYNQSTGRASIHVVTSDRFGEVVVTATTEDGGYTVNYHFTIENEPVVIEAEHFTSTDGSNGGAEIFTIGQDSAILVDNLNDNVHYYGTPVPENGIYKIRLHVAATALSLADVTVDYTSTVRCTIPRTGSHEVFETLTLDEEYDLNAGTHYFKFKGAGMAIPGVKWSMDKFELVKQEDSHEPVWSVDLTDDFELLQIGENYQLYKEITPTYASDKTVTWSSKDNSIATVDGNGLVTAVSCGKTRIVVTTNDGGFKDSCVVKIPCQTDFVLEAEDFVETGGTVDDSPWGGPGYGVNNAGANINWVNTGDWAEYDLEIFESGKYQVDYFVGTPITGAALELSINGVSYLTDPIPNNGDWDTYDSVSASKYFELEPGSYTIQIKGSGTEGWEWNMDKFTFTKIGEKCEYQSSILKASVAERTGVYIGAMEGLLEQSDEFEESSAISQKDNNLDIYPNPASSNLKVAFVVEQPQLVNLQILNIVGEVQDVVVNNQMLNEGTYEINHNIDKLDAGIYLVKFDNGINTTVERLVVE